MTKATPDSRRLSQMSPHEDPHHLADLFRSAKAAPEEDLPRLRWRLRASLRHRATRPRRFLRIALITGVVFLTGGMVGAVVAPYWERKSTGPVPKAEPPARAAPQPIRRRSVSAPAEAKPAESLAAPMEDLTVENVPAPVASHRATQRVAGRRALTPAPISDSGPPTEVPAAPPPPSPVEIEQALLGDALKSLRKQHDPQAALAMLDDHARRFPDTALAPEAAMLRVESLLDLGRNAEALSVLDRVAFGSAPNQDERLVLRGELRAAAGRWREAREDFEASLSDLAAAKMDSKSRDASERALWGRASARSHLGDEAGARAESGPVFANFPLGTIRRASGGVAPRFPMKRQIRALVAAIPLAVAAAPGADAETNLETNLVVHSDSDCPSGQAVAEALWAIRPDSEWPALTATIHMVEDRVQVTLGEDRNHRREIAVPADCADRANRVALVIAVWSGELPAHAAGAPTLSVAVPAPKPAPTPRPKKSAMVTELGLAGFYSAVGGWVPGGKVELGRFRRDGWWGLRAFGAYQSAKSLRVDIGDSPYDRTLLGAAMVLRWDRPRLFLSSDWGLVGALTRAQGNGYSQNQSASGLNAGLAADGRVGLRLGASRVWAEARLYRWLRKETIQVDPVVTGASTTSTLPAWDAHLGIGASMAFD